MQKGEHGTISINLTSCDDPEIQIKECLQIINEINKALSRANKMTIQLSSLRWILPCAALLISHKINELKTKNVEINFIEPEEISVRNYLSTVGFPFGGTNSKLTYMPIHHFVNDGKNQTKIIEKEIDEIFELVRKHFPENLWNSIFYLLGELSDNIDQHSKFTSGSVMVQFYKSKGYIDIGVLDNGLTIPGVYEKSNIEIESDWDALSKALRGMSTKEGEIGRGKGLETSKKLVTLGLKGDFYLLSRKGILIDKEGETPQFKETNFSLDGTLVYARFKTPKKNLNIYDYIG